MPIGSVWNQDRRYYVRWTFSPRANSLSQLVSSLGIRSWGLTEHVERPDGFKTKLRAYITWHVAIVLCVAPAHGVRVGLGDFGIGQRTGSRSGRKYCLADQPQKSIGSAAEAAEIVGD